MLPAVAANASLRCPVRGPVHCPVRCARLIRRFSFVVQSLFFFRGSGVPKPGPYTMSSTLLNYFTDIIIQDCVNTNRLHTVQAIHEIHCCAILYII